MSAFIVSNECVQTIVWHLIRTRRTFGGFSFPEGTRTIAGREAVVGLGNALFAMNARSVADRYRNRSEDCAMPYEHGGHPAQPIATYKAIQCFLYQCDEGEVPSEPLYKELHEVARDLAEKIVHETEAYSAAAWG